MNEGTGPSPFKYHLELTPAQLKLTHTALRSLLDDFGHDDRGVHDVIRQILDKLPDEHAIRAIRLDDEIERGIRDVKPDAAASDSAPQPTPPSIGGDPPDTVA
jgi:hypothetical protein